jgi:dolichol-phosphate mannosyltransferase
MASGVARIARQGRSNRRRGCAFCFPSVCGCSYPAAVPVELSVIVPVFNEAANILPLTRELAAALGGHAGGYELLFVDDASTDETWMRIREAHALHPPARGLRHDRNAGQSAALWTGIRQAGGRLLATLDGDLQNDPADLPRLLAELDDCDLVCGNRVRRQDSFLRRFSSVVARQARRIVLGGDLHDTGCALRVFRREALDGLFGFNGLHRFLPILIQRTGGRVKELPVNHRPRTAGVSKYGIGNRLWRGIVDLYGVAWYCRRRLPVIPTEEFPGPKSA